VFKFRDENLITGESRFPGNQQEGQTKLQHNLFHAFECLPVGTNYLASFERLLSGMALATGWWSQEKPAASALPLTGKSDTYLSNDA
jgi:hypothetical protein